MLTHGTEESATLSASEQSLLHLCHPGVDLPDKLPGKGPHPVWSATWVTQQLPANALQRRLLQYTMPGAGTQHTGLARQQLITRTLVLRSPARGCMGTPRAQPRWRCPGQTQSRACCAAQSPAGACAARPAHEPRPRNTPAAVPPRMPLPASRRGSLRGPAATARARALINTLLRLSSCKPASA